MRGVSKAGGELCSAPAVAPVVNPVFGVTPAALVVSGFGDMGVFDAAAVAIDALDVRGRAFPAASRSY